MQPVDELGLRIAHQPVERRHRRQHLEDSVGLRPELQRDIGRSATAMIETSEVSLKSDTQVEASAGSTRITACGKTMRQT